MEFAMILMVYFILCILFEATSSADAQCSTSGINQCSITLNQRGNPSPSPLAFDSATVQYVKTNTPLTFTQYNVQRATYTLQNDGSTITVTPHRNAVNYLTGGLLGTEKYILTLIRFYWIDNYAKACCYTIDNIGVPLTVEVIYKNTKTGGRGYPYAIYRSLVSVEGTYDNPDFTVFENILTNLVTAGSSEVYSNTSALFPWFNVADYAVFYYGYKGSIYRFNANNAQTYNAYFLTSPIHATATISVCQFQLFEQILNRRGTYSSPTQPSYSADQLKTQIYQGVGYKIVDYQGLPGK